MGGVPRGGHIYFTKNGVAVGVAFSGVSSKQLWPTIGLGAEGEVRAQLADCWLTAGDSDWLQVIRVNFDSSWLCARPAAVVMETPPKAKPAADKTPVLTSPKSMATLPLHSPEALPLQQVAIELPSELRHPRAFTPRSGGSRLHGGVRGAVMGTTGAMAGAASRSGWVKDATVSPTPLQVRAAVAQLATDWHW